MSDNLSSKFVRAEVLFYSRGMIEPSMIPTIDPESFWQYLVQYDSIHRHDTKRQIYEQSAAISKGRESAGTNESQGTH